GILGLVFCAWQVRQHRIKSHLPYAGSTKNWRPKLYGFSSGVTSTIAHAAGPVMQMYFLPTGLAKTQFAATSVYFFLFLNTIKLVPFALLGRFSKEQLTANLWMMPILPVGVLIGYGIVRVMHERLYTRFIYLTLVLTSILLIYRALTGI
ncbi:MAG: sulfite exporter TauE/SafE family protein, partial [Desulfofustis sp.]|nr:sulfite exporter TauE/SafE family protein [Desulfofustis sp.]